VHTGLAASGDSTHKKHIMLWPWLQGETRPSLPTTHRLPLLVFAAKEVSSQQPAAVTRYNMLQHNKAAVHFYKSACLLSLCTSALRIVTCRRQSLPSAKLAQFSTIIPATAAAAITFVRSRLASR
jgi:hypothetical protein